MYSRTSDSAAGKVTITLVALTVFIFCLEGCSEDTGVGPSPVPTTTLSGNYNLASFTHNNGGEFFRLAFDGANMTATELADSDGSVDLSPTTLPYGCDGTGLVAIGGAAAWGIEGGDGRFFGFLTPDTPSEIHLGVKAATSLSPADISGTYYFANYEYGNTARFGTFAFDGTSTGSYQHIVNTGESIGSGDMPFVLSSDGSFTAGGLEIRGAFSDDGQILNFIDISSGDDREFALAIKRGSGLSNATLSGTYNFINYEGDDVVRLATGRFNGNGSATFQHIRCSDNEIESGTLAYSVASDGRFSATGDGGTPMYGAVSADGSIITAIIVHTGAEHEFFVGVRSKK